eukprot:g8206.t1
MKRSIASFAILVGAFQGMVNPIDSVSLRVDGSAMIKRIEAENARLIRENMALQEALIELGMPKRSEKVPGGKYAKYILPPSECTKQGMCIEKQFDPNHYTPCEDTYYLPACLTMCKNDFIECTKRVQGVKNALPDFTVPLYERKQIMLNLEKDIVVSKVVNPYTPGAAPKPRPQNASKASNISAVREAVEESDRKELNATLNNMFSASLKPGGGAAMAKMMQDKVEKSQSKQKDLEDIDKKAKKKAILKVS